MRLRWSKSFAREFRDLSSEDKKAVRAAIDQFVDDPFSPGLRNHALTGPLSDRRAFAADQDVRIIFTERGNYQDVTFLAIGPHKKVYSP